MDPDRLQAISERDQLWASLRGLKGEIERLGSGEFDGTPRDAQMITLLARIVIAEMEFREHDGTAAEA